MATDEIGSSCPVCRAPTERIAVLRDRLLPKNPHAVALGRLGGVTPQRRREIARRAILTRWKRAKR
jgi:hypothetical protein